MLNHQPRGATISTGREEFGIGILERARKLAEWSETPNGLTCTYLSPAHKAVARQLCDWMHESGLDVHVDAVGNVAGRYSSGIPSVKTLIVASHYDTVVNAGKYDGRLGILTAIAVAGYLQRAKYRLPFHLEVIAFAEEEGVRFSAPYLGSRAITGRFEPADLERRDANGLTLQELLRHNGVEYDAVRALARRPDSLRGYLEVHIEQGPVLLERDLPVGIVSSIAGTARYRVTVRGTGGHAGTVPMTLRRDAAAAAAEIVLAVEKRCASAPGLVGTVGQLSVPGGLINVIPARCELSIDVRAGDDATRDAAIADILAEIEAIAGRRGVNAEVLEIGRHAAVPCAEEMQSVLSEAVARAGITPYRLASGAGHDAAMLAGLTGIGMLFVRCGNGGISHSPLETVTLEDTDVAARILLDAIVNMP
jgi:hydantoinase/carbamoylase family amidase